jgi:hypothetical protein
MIWLSWVRIRIGNADPDPDTDHTGKNLLKNEKKLVSCLSKGFCTTFVFVGTRTVPMFFNLLRN